jgi:TP901 family phage tail tape measure protein
LNILLTGDSTQLKSTFLSATKSSTAAIAGIAGVTAAAVALGKALYDIGGEFEHANNIIRAGTGATGKHLKKLEDDFKSVFSHVPASAEETATAITELAKRLDLPDKPLRERAHQFLELSRMTGEDLPSSIKASAQAFEDWEVPVKQQGKVLDELFRTSQKTGGGVGELAETVNKFGPQLRNLHIPLSKAIALFGAFEKAGVQNTKVGAALNLAFKNLVEGTVNVEKKIAPKDTGKKVFELFKGFEKGAVSAERIFEVFGSKSGAAIIQAVNQGRFSVGEFQKQVEQGNETINKAGEATKTTSDHFKELGNKLKVFVAPAAEFVYDNINKLAGSLAKLNFKRIIREAGLTKGTLRELGNAIHDLGQISGPGLGTYLKAGLTAFKGFAQQLKGLSELISGVLTLNIGKAWKGVKDIFVGGIKQSLGVLWDMSAPLRGLLGKLGGTMSKGFANAWGNIKNIFNSGKEAVVGVLNAIITAIDLIPGINIGLIGEGGGGKGRGAPAGPHGPVGHHYSGGAITRPTAIVGEEAPQHPEWVIATNPAYRRDNLSYWARAGHDLGVPGFLSGGSIASGIGSAVGTAISSLPMTGGTPSAGSAASVIGNLPTPHLPQPLTGLGPWLISKVTGWIKHQFQSIVGGGGSKGPNGVGSFMGLPMADWVIESLRFAQGKGVAVRPTSGYRPGYDPHTASGHSEHSGTQYPHGAVDFGGPVDPAALAMKMGVVHATAGFKYPLLAPIGFHDDGHASGTGHFKGGRMFGRFLGGFAKGGKLPSWIHGGSTLNADQLASLAHYVGMPNPGLMSQIAQAESGGNPHAMGGEGDKGLWQIIPSTASAFGINYGSLFDPLANAKGAAKILAGQGLSAWHTYTSGAYSGEPKGTVSALGAAATERAKKEKEHFKFGLQAAKPVLLPPLHKTALPASAAALPKSIRRMLQAPGLHYAGKVAISELAAERASLTETKTDDLAVDDYQEDLFKHRKAQLLGKLKHVNSALRKANSPDQRHRLLAQRTHIQEELGTVEGGLSGVRTSRHEANEPPEPGEEPKDEAAEKQLEATEALTQAIEEHKQSEDELKAEMKRQIDFAESATSTSSATAWQALADILSGNLGMRTLAGAQTAGAGGVGSF